MAPAATIEVEPRPQAFGDIVGFLKSGLALLKHLQFGGGDSAKGLAGARGAVTWTRVGLGLDRQAASKECCDCFVHRSASMTY